MVCLYQIGAQSAFPDASDIMLLGWFPLLNVYSVGYVTVCSKETSHTSTTKLLWIVYIGGTEETSLNLCQYDPLFGLCAFNAYCFC